MFTKYRLQRKKYIGVCKWKSEIVAKMMSRFPRTVIRYMDRNNTKRAGCNVESSEIPRRRNSEILESFIGNKWLKLLAEMRKNKAL
jgi:hypothetical protein